FGLAEALDYLRMNKLPHLDAPNGYILTKYKGIPLGFVKNMDNRVNSLYPQAWRLRI
ncbi:MAG: hypothetical protein HUJ91_01985, partial [Bacteroidales bacterium]|nr:hypothetical protein [Bacteroidales bacterium]